MEICIGGEGAAVTEAIAHVKSILPEIQVWRMRTGSESLTKNSLRLISADSLEGATSVDSRQAVENPDLLTIIFNYPTDDLRKKVRSKKLFKIHYSLLPKYRGFFTSSWPIICGDFESGTSLHVVDTGIDTGDIIAQNSFYISESCTAHDLSRRHTECAVRLFKENLGMLLAGTFSLRCQPKIGATFFGSDSINIKEPIINFLATAHQVSRQVRGHIISSDITPKIAGFKIRGIDITSRRSELPPGTLINTTPEYFDYATADYDVRLWRIAF